MGLIRKVLPVLVVFVGFVLLSHGLNMIYEPAWWILTGVILIAVGLVHDWDRGGS